MRNDTGSPEAQVVIYAISRGEYDAWLWELMQAIRRRRRVRDLAGVPVISRGDLVELMDDLERRALRSARCRVLDVTSRRDKIKVRIEETHEQTYLSGRVVWIPRHWVFFTVGEE